MRGQDGNAFPGNFYLDYGSNGINLRRTQNNGVLVEDLLHNGHPIVDWIGQLNSQNPVRFQDLLVEDGLPSSPATGPVIGPVIDQSLLERHSEPIVRNLTNMSLENGNLTNIPLSLELGRSNLLPQNIDLNTTGDSHDIDVYLNSRIGLCPNPFEPGRENTSSNFDPLVISSGIAGYVVEENDNREGHSSYGRRLSCKRRAPEDGLENFSLGESSRSNHLTVTTQENNSRRRLDLSAPHISHSNVQYSEHLGVALLNGFGTTPVMHQTSGFEINGLGNGVGASSDIHQTPRVVGESENSYRNIYMRRTLNHQDFASPNLARWTTRTSYAQLPSQPNVVFPFDGSPNANTSSMTGIIHSIPTPQSNLTSNSLEAFQPFQWNETTRLRTGLLPTIYASNGDALLLNNNPSFNASTVMVPVEFDRINAEHMSINVNFVAATNSSGNIASNSINNSYSCNHPSLAPIRLSQGNMAQQPYAQRIMDMVNGIESQGQGNYCPLHLGVNLATRERELSTRERELSARGGNFRPSSLPLRSELIARPEIQNGVHPDVAFRSFTAAQRRGRLVSEIRNALALVRRAGLLRFEDVMVFDRSVLYGVPEEPDLYDDMRLDVDNMSYEELLALEDQIGNVCTGISEEAIQSHMKRQKYQAKKIGSPLEVEPCCICQEEYANGQDLGKLDCGHDFHFNCIKLWLVQKNSCPICKMTALEF